MLIAEADRCICCAGLLLMGRRPNVSPELSEQTVGDSTEMLSSEKIRLLVMREGSGEESSYPLYPLSCDNASTCMLGGKFLLLLRKLPFRRAPNARGPRPRHRVVQAVAVVLEGSHSKSAEFWELESFIPLLPKKRRTLDSLLKRQKQNSLDADRDRKPHSAKRLCFSVLSTSSIF